jgi:hypothetical protein
VLSFVDPNSRCQIVRGARDLDGLCGAEPGEQLLLGVLGASLEHLVAQEPAALFERDALLRQARLAENYVVAEDGLRGFAHATGCELQRSLRENRVEALFRISGRLVGVDHATVRRDWRQPFDTDLHALVRHGASHAQELGRVFDILYGLVDLMSDGSRFGFVRGLFDER